MGFTLGWAWLLARLPAAWADALGAALGATWHWLLPIRRGVARRNVLKSLEITPVAARRLVASVYRHYGRSLVEVLRSAAGRPPPVQIFGQGHLDAAAARGRGVLVLSAHLGAFEVLVRVAAAQAVPVHVVTRQFRSATAQAIWRRLRRGGPSLLPAGASARATLAALGRGEVVVFVLDQHTPPGRAVWVPFFGRPAATNPDLARLARRTGAAVVPIFTWRTGRTHRVEIQPALDVPLLPGEAGLVAATARYAEVVEAAVRAHPDQWLWIHRRWKPLPADVQAAIGGTGHAGRRRTFKGAGRAMPPHPHCPDPASGPPPTASAPPPNPPAAPGPPPG